MRETFDAIMASYDHMANTKPLAYRLAYIADLEATFTPSFRFLLDNADIMFRPGDDRVASLLLWHRVEEVEHRSSAVSSTTLSSAGDCIGCAHSRASSGTSRGPSFRSTSAA